MSDSASMPILDRDYARLMLVMKRLIKEEFGERIAVAEEGVHHQMIAYAERSADLSLREMGRELAQRLGLDETGDLQAVEGERVVYYRGVARAVSEDKPKTDSGRSRYLYRGQPVRG